MSISFKGMVVKGDGIAGRIFGVATANLEPSAVPAVDHGIYAGWVDYDGERFGAAISYGEDGGEPKFEIHIIDFDKDILGKELSGELEKKVSEYVRGYSVERLRQKIIHDIGLCRQHLAING